MLSKKEVKRKIPPRRDFSFRQVRAADLSLAFPATLSVFWQFESLDGDLEDKFLFLRYHCTTARWKSGSCTREYLIIGLSQGLGEPGYRIGTKTFEKYNYDPCKRI
jgi:hypothetical protein